MTNSQQPLTYRSAGVDIDAGNALVERIKPAAARTRRPEVLAGLGGFGAMFELPWARYRNPVLVAGTDGVGTKLKVALELERHDSVGIDLVAMCVNDLVVQGAEPLFFLDYYATGRLDVEVAARVVEGIAQGCEQAGAALIGGETAEMPGMYSGGDYDLAGFCVGIVEKSEIIDGSNIAPGDALIALASSGPHSNGYSLIRRVLELGDLELRDTLPKDSERRTIGEVLLTPTRIYVQPLLKLFRDPELRPAVKGLAHITGGGIWENVPRMLPAAARAVIDPATWNFPPVFQWLQEQGQIDSDEMLRTFNCGVGMVAAVDADRCAEIMAVLETAGERPWIIGGVEPSGGAAEVIVRTRPQRP